MNLLTRRDSLCYLNRQLQCRCRLRTRNARLASRTGAFNKRSKLKLKRFPALDLDPVTHDLFPETPVDFAALILIIEREISVLLKDANLAQALGTNPARGDVCHATIFEMQPRIGDVFTLAKDWHAYRVNAPERRAHEMQNDFQVVDH